MTKPTQIKIITNQLKTTGYISRNWCLQRYITRLSAYILALKKEGWQFSTDWQNGDYFYRITGRPEYKSMQKYWD